MPKGSSESDKWLILQAPERISLRRDDFVPALDDRAPLPLPRPRSPTGHSGLPCDWLFSMATEAVLIVESSTWRIAQANPAAAELLRIPQPGLVGRHVAEAFDASSMEAVMLAIDAARSEEPADEVICRSAGGGSDLRANASLFRAETGSYLLIRLELLGARDALEEAAPGSPVFDAIESAPVSFLLTDAGFRVEYANQAFVDLVELPQPGAPRGKSLLNWLDLTAADLARLRDQMLRRQASSDLTTILRPERGAPLEVEVCAVAVPDGPHVCWGFTIRELPRLN